MKAAHLAKIHRVILSCRTLEQLNNADKWVAFYIFRKKSPAWVIRTGTDIAKLIQSMRLQIKSWNEDEAINGK